MEVCKVKRDSIHQMVTLAMLAAVSVVLMYLVRFPLFAAAPFLEYDMADVPILIGTFLFGPWSGLLLTIVVSILQGVTVSAGSGWIGILMHIVATGTFVVVAGLMYQARRTRINAIFALICGSLAMTLMMIPLNLIFTVYFMGVPRETVVSMLVPIIIPFNLIKAVINSGVTFAVYKPISRSVARLTSLELPEVSTDRKM
ncbi:MAG: ECF transporter S component [Limnochordia bacterium]|nr:ECF transporter S component [Limnochordia bacterium]MDD4516914.1 ECF transporter S component [Limnochordia bacterium]